MDREINSRTNSGTTVKLIGHFGASGKCEYCIVDVVSETEMFNITEIPLDKAKDVYFHPFYYAGRLLTTGTIS